MTCTTCTKVKPINSCTQTLIVGTIANVSTAVIVTVKNITLGNQVKYNITSDGDGLITLTGISLSDFSYELSMALASDPNNDIQFTIANGAITVVVDCVSFSGNKLGGVVIKPFVDSQNAAQQFNQVQSDWNVTDDQLKSFIKNKPDLGFFAYVSIDVPNKILQITDPSAQAGINLNGDTGFVNLFGVNGLKINGVIQPKVYRALMTQSGTDAPVATILENTTGVTPVWSRSSAGTYNLTSTGLFPAGKTYIENASYYISPVSADDIFFSATRANDNTVAVFSTDDGWLADAPFTIYIYP